ncbi:MAG: esterase-like activity of phytase family protein [Rhizobiaceae bacterium]
MIRVLTAALAVAFAAFLASGFLAKEDNDRRADQPTPIDASPISPEGFALTGASMKADGLRFVGGLVLRSTNQHFGSLSGMRITDHGILTAVSDTGFWFQGEIARDANGLPTGISGGRMAPLLDGEGRPFSQKWFGDAEGLTFQNRVAFVSTEQDARIIRYEIGSDLLDAWSSIFGPPLPGDRLAYNRGLEAIATLPERHAYAGSLIAISEAPPGFKDSIRAFIWSENSVTEFSINSHDRFSITDADFLPDGNLLLLERRFSPADGPAMRLRKIDGSAIKPDARLDGDILLDLDWRWQIDNMEGVSVFTTAGGKQRAGLISDDNKWPLQRTLYLEFEFES